MSHAGSSIANVITLGAYNKEKEAEAQADQLAAAEKAQVGAISPPNVASTQSALQATEQRAASASGTIFSNQASNAIGDGSGRPRKQLLGS